ncbi:MAG: hypothetical protein K6F84_06510 [Lachnospiraceae bacterium]|nr:hypothetical protein [Lachnospiraceae bacterium]
MNFAILASVIILGIAVSLANRMNNSKETKAENDFWERERKSNFVRKKSLDSLDYITIPLDKLPVDILNEDSTVKDCINRLRVLSECKIVNFTGYTNTDLKLEYGTANISLLSEYDESFTELAHILSIWEQKLFKEGFFDETKSICEYAVSIGSDVKSSYLDLADIYLNENTPEKIDELIEKARGLKSANAPVITRLLKEKIQ